LPQPYLVIIAGCNGSGKSTFSKNLVRDVIPFDFDKRTQEIYTSMYDSELRSEIAHNAARSEFESSINGAFSNGMSFCYETNFHSSPLHWAQRAKELGYRLELQFICLDSLELAKKRVFIRTEYNKGHFVQDIEVDNRWKDGYKNLNLNFHFFDSVILLDNSFDKSIQPMFVLTKNDKNGFSVDFYQKKIPSYAKHRFPEIYKILKEEKSKQYSVSGFIKRYF
jgi:predicted ABC-type ATPase